MPLRRAARAFIAGGLGMKASLVVVSLCLGSCGRVGVYELARATSADAGMQPADAGSAPMDASVADSGARDAGPDTSMPLERCPTPPAAAATRLLIDDAEDGDGAIASVEGRRGEWYTVNDGTSGATQDPAPGATVVAAVGGAHGSGYAIHMQGSGFRTWGASLGVTLSEATQGQCPYDASNTKGIRFYAKGTGSITISVATSPTVPTAEGGTCGARCFDYYAVREQLSSDWQQYQFTWSELRQSGWGAAVSFSAAEIMYIEFAFGVNVNFDLYVDDLSFF